MQKEDSEGTTTLIPTGEQRESVEDTTTLIPMGNQREDLEGIETSIPMGEQRVPVPGGHHNPHPHRKVGSRIRGAETLPGRYQHCAQGGAGRFPNKE